MKNILSLIIFLVPFIASTQVSFEEHIIADNSHLPENAVHVQLADLDGDGDNDLLVASQDDHKISWFRNTDGEGSFGKQQVISLDVFQAQFVRTADLDGDGDLDVIGVGRENILRGFINLGDGMFSDVILLAADDEDGVLPRNVHVADVDLDGKMDLIVASATHEIWYYRNLNNELEYQKSKVSEGYFYAEFSYIPRYYFDIGDIDVDGDVDIISPSINYQALSWQENIDGEFVTHDIEGFEGRYDIY